MRVILSLLMVCVLGACGKEIDGVKMCKESKWNVNLPMTFSVEGGINKSELDKAVKFWNDYFSREVFKEDAKGESLIKLEDKKGRVLGTSQSWTTGETAVYFVVLIDPLGNVAQTIAHELGHALGLNHTQGGLMDPIANPSFQVICTR